MIPTSQIGIIYICELMEITFYKYQGTGNDFVIIDNRSGHFPKDNVELIEKMCHRRFGIGADGLMLLEKHPTADFKMVYYNSDGRIGTMCGNGGRCMVHFANYLGVISDRTDFEASDGMHTGIIKEDWVSLGMADVREIAVSENFIFLNTGSPHHIESVNALKEYDVVSNGRRIRNEQYGEAGSNVNFVEQLGEARFAVRTYERGVEDETLSCGTGVTAVAIGMFETEKTKSNSISLETKGGQLNIRFKKEQGIYKDIYLEGPAEQVFKGRWV